MHCVCSACTQSYLPGMTTCCASAQAKCVFCTGSAVRGASRQDHPATDSPDCVKAITKKDLVNAKKLVAKYVKEAPVKVSAVWLLTWLQLYTELRAKALCQTRFKKVTDAALLQPLVKKKQSRSKKRAREASKLVEEFGCVSSLSTA